ncbi:MAG: TonB family protein [Paludibacteraceae bacterium]|nr:TonB family protein [Paludibacteraceae bacterium]
MKIKKSPKADLENKRSMFVLVGLVLALGFTYICFEWTNKEVTVADNDMMTDMTINDSEELPPPTTQEQPEVKPQTPPPAAVVQEVLNVVDNETETTANLTMDNPEETNQAQDFSAAEIQEETNEEEEEEIFIVVEKYASFPGGQAKLMEFLKKELQYPQVAIENNVQGRVFVEFVVNKDGSIQDVKVARGVDSNLDAEAIRVVKKMPKWTPAEQRGKPCRSRFTLPVLFRFK